MILLFPNQTAARLHAEACPPVPLPNETLVSVSPERMGSEYALKVVGERPLDEMRTVRRVRYYHET